MEPNSRRPRRGIGKTILEYALTIVIALVVAVLIKTFLVQPFFIPSASMRPTLVENDKILVSKLHPGILDIERGDIIVFEDPDNWVGADPNAQLTPRQQFARVLSYVGLAPDPSENHLVKRLIGKPGDRVTCTVRGGPMSVNGVELDEPYINPDSGACQTTFDVRVPAGKLWVMGDNRFSSADSAFHYSQGGNPYVDQQLVTGRAVVIFLPVDRWRILDDGRATFSDVPAASASALRPDSLPAFAAAA